MQVPALQTGDGSAPAGAFIPSNPAFPRMQIQAWQLLGYMLHAAEDFYAHSTWVDEGNTVPLPTGFGTLTENTATPTIPPIFSKTLQGTYCPAPAGFPVLPSINACPGFFSPANTLNLHQIAVGLAEQEAQTFVQSIVTDLVTANNAAGFCALLGLPSSTPMCNACSPVEGASSCAAVLYTQASTIQANWGAGTSRRNANRQWNHYPGQRRVRYGYVPT